MIILPGGDLPEASQIDESADDMVEPGPAARGARTHGQPRGGGDLRRVETQESRGIRELSGGDGPCPGKTAERAREHVDGNGRAREYERRQAGQVSAENE